jgi:hypothetical protein
MNYHPAAWVRDFRIKHGQLSANLPTLPPYDQLMDELDKVTEEYIELAEAVVAAENLVHIAKELGDNIIVIHSLAQLLGIPLENVVQRVADSNATKDSVAGYTGKVPKGPNYKPPFLHDLIYPEEMYRC